MVEIFNIKLAMDDWMSGDVRQGSEEAFIENIS